MRFKQSAIPDILLVEPDVYHDDRGWFMEAFSEPRFHEALKALGLSVPASFVQDNYTRSKKGALRGLHYQVSPYSQGKLVQVLNGEGYAVAVDLRPDSNTYGKWVAEHLSAGNQKMLWIPEGFAHGFLSLVEDTLLVFKTTHTYSLEHERCLRWDDPVLGIDWPATDRVIVSEKDARAPLFRDLDAHELTYIHSDVVHHDFQVIGDLRGSLIPLEIGMNIPFEVRRAYYIYGTKEGVSRGFHAHKRLHQMAVCVAGKCRMVLDDGTTRQETWLDAPNKGLLISNLIWREMHDFSEDCVLLVLASAHYDESDYIRDYQVFQQEALRAQR